MSYDFIAPWQVNSATCIAGAPQVFKSRLICRSAHFPISTAQAGCPPTQWRAEAALTTTSEMKRLRRGTTLIPNSKLWINLAVPGY